MCSSQREQRLYAWLQAPFERYDDADIVIVTIPVVFSAGITLWWLLGVRFCLAMGWSAVLSIGVLVDALYLNPPTP